MEFPISFVSAVVAAVILPVALVAAISRLSDRHHYSTKRESNSDLTYANEQNPQKVMAHGILPVVGWTCCL